MNSSTALGAKHGRIAANSRRRCGWESAALNDIESSMSAEAHEHEQGLTARMMDHPDSKVALNAVQTGETPAYPDMRVDVRPTVAETMWPPHAHP